MRLVLFVPECGQYVGQGAACESEEAAEKGEHGWDSFGKKVAATS